MERTIPFDIDLKIPVHFETTVCCYFKKKGGSAIITPGHSTRTGNQTLTYRNTYCHKGREIHINFQTIFDEVYL